MIAISNMEKPKGCWDCFNYDCDHWGEHGYDNSTDCPLIEIDEAYVKRRSISHIFFFQYREADEKTRLMLDEMFKQILDEPTIGERRADE